MTNATLNKRINVILPKETISLLAEHASKGERSHLIDLALRRYLSEDYRAKFRQDLADGYRRNSKNNIELAEVWKPLEEELWAKKSR